MYIPSHTLPVGGTVTPNLLVTRERETRSSNYRQNEGKDGFF